jgi:hypothetical protein
MDFLCVLQRKKTGLYEKTSTSQPDRWFGQKSALERTRFAVRTNWDLFGPETVRTGLPKSEPFPIWVRPLLWGVLF